MESLLDRVKTRCCSAPRCKVDNVLASLTLVPCLASWLGDATGVFVRVPQQGGPTASQDPVQERCCDPNKHSFARKWKLCQLRNSKGVHHYQQESIVANIYIYIYI